MISWFAGIVSLVWVIGLLYLRWRWFTSLGSIKMPLRTPGEREIGREGQRLEQLGESLDTLADMHRRGELSDQENARAKATIIRQRTQDH